MYFPTANSWLEAIGYERSTVSLRDLKQKDLLYLVPTRGQSTGTDPAANSNERAGMDIMYQAKLERHLE
jgi:hypothetical protein